MRKKSQDEKSKDDPNYLKIVTIITSILASAAAFIGVFWGPDLTRAVLFPTLTPTPTLTVSPIASATLPAMLIPSVTDTVPATSQALFPTYTPVDTPSPATCPWIPYLNGAASSSLSSENCLNDLKSDGISGSEKQVFFFLDGAPLGMYGACQDITDQENLSVHVEVRDDIASARFLITIGPDPTPNISAYGFRIQPDAQPKQATEMYVKFIQYTPAGYDKEINEIHAIKYWHAINEWNFDFVFHFSGAQVDASMNKALFEEWQSTSLKRYLCFAYEAMPTDTQATQLDVHITAR